MKFGLFIAAIIGGAFNLLFVFNKQIYSQELTSIANYATLINHCLFFIALFLMLATFFIKSKHYRFFGSLLIIIGVLYITLMLAFKNANYFYLIPLGCYSLTGYMLIANPKNH